MVKFRNAFPILYARDIERSIEFYTGILGFELGFRWPPEGAADYVVLRLDGRPLGITVSTAPEQLLGEPVGSGPRFELCIYTDDVDASLAEIRARGVPVLREPEDMPWGERMAYVADPDGNPVNITAVPRTRGMKRDSRQRFAAIALGLISVGLLWLVGIDGHAEQSPRLGANTGRAAKPAARRVPQSRDGLDMVGKPAPEWRSLVWLNSPPLHLKELRGKVGLLRFWTNTCPFCAATAPALRQIDQDFARRGVVVIGMYHPKPPGADRPAREVEQTFRGWGWRFPVGLDMHWKALEAFWLNGPAREATSASFLMDQRGIIRWVHPGPEYHPGGPADHQQCRDDYRDLRQAIEALLAEVRAAHGGDARG